MLMEWDDRQIEIWKMEGKISTDVSAGVHTGIDGKEI